MHLYHFLSLLPPLPFFTSLSKRETNSFHGHVVLASTLALYKMNLVGNGQFDELSKRG